MKPDIQLPAIFTDCNTCALTAYGLRTVRTQARTIGSAWKSTTLSAMQSRVLSLLLDGSLHSFEEARRSVRYLGSDPRHAVGLQHDATRTVAIRKIVTKQLITLMLIDEQINRPIAVIGESLAWYLDGLDVRLLIDRTEVAV